MAPDARIRPRGNTLVGMTDDRRFWYNDRTGQVEEGEQSNSYDRIGPFATREEAERAPEKLQENSRKWAEEDEADA